MATNTMARSPSSRFLADTLLNGAATAWLTVAVMGQWVFLYYILVFYGPSSLSGHFELWRKNHGLVRGYVPGDTAGNLSFAVHAMLVAYVTFGGALQLIPQLRSLAPSFHRWNGRMFMLTALGVSVTGLHMVWVRGAVLNELGAVSISLNAAAIILCAALAWRTAIRRDFAGHRRWALRTYLVANGQWFFRVGVFAWIVINQGEVGIGANFDGPFIVFWAFECYLVPLAVLELYLTAKDRAGPGGRYAVACTLGMLTIVTGIGIFGTYTMFWQPVLERI